MTRKIELSNTPDLVKQYIAGKSVNKLASENGVGRFAMSRILTDEGIVLRTQSEAETAKWALMTPVQRANQVRSAHAAAKGRIASESELIAKANAREANWDKHITIDESNLLFALGQNITPQKAVGIYNIDLALNEFSIAVEIYGGGWHASGRHFTRHFERTKYLLNLGWTVVIVWTDGRRHPFTYGTAYYIIELAEVFSARPPVLPQYHVILGDGNLAPTIKSKLNSDNIIERLGCRRDPSGYANFVSG